MIDQNANVAALDLFAPTIYGPMADLMDTQRRVAWVTLGCIIGKTWRRCGEGEVSEGHLVLRFPVLSLIVDIRFHHREEDVTIDILTRASTSTHMLGMKTKRKMMKTMKKARTGKKKAAITPQTALMTGKDSV